MSGRRRGDPRISRTNRRGEGVPRFPGGENLDAAGGSERMGSLLRLYGPFGIDFRPREARNFQPGSNGEFVHRLRGTIHHRCSPRLGVLGGHGLEDLVHEGTATKIVLEMDTD